MTFSDKNPQEITDKISKFLTPRNIIIVIITLIVFSITANAIVVVPGGYRAVVFSKFTGVSDKILGEGIHIITPFIDTPNLVDVRIQKETADATASSKDLQGITTSITLNWHFQPENVKHAYQEIGGNIPEKIIDPAIQETVKAITAKYTAEQLVIKRENVRNDIVTALKQKLLKSYIIVDELNITNFSFSPDFVKAIEAKQIAEQNALKAKNDLERIKVEAKQKVTTAQADAESIRIQGQALLQNPQLTQLKAVEKWNGKLPDVVGGNIIPFINLPLNKPTTTPTN